MIRLKSRLTRPCARTLSEQSVPQPSLHAGCPRRKARWRSLPPRDSSEGKARSNKVSTRSYLAHTSCGQGMKVKEVTPRTSKRGSGEPSLPGRGSPREWGVLGPGR